MRFYQSVMCSAYLIIGSRTIPIYGDGQRADLVPLHTVCKTIPVDLVWASGKNEFGMVLYPRGAPCYLHRDAAQALARVQQRAEANGYSLKVLEAYRPLWAQKKIWKRINFVPPSGIYGRHPLGTAVDVTLVRLSDGKELALPPRHSEVSATMMPTDEQLRNAQLLRDMMMQEKFEPHDEEWFHFDYHGWQNFSARNDLIEE
jgi:D-alanyl-D-alanine dipeptidase